MSKNNNAVIASAAVRKAYTTARNAEAKAYGAFVTFIMENAGAVCDALKKEAVSVAEFATYMGDDLSVGKEVSLSDKAERNRIRARIRYGLDQAGKLEEKARSPKQGKKGKKAKTAGEAAAAAVDSAEQVKDTNPKDRFNAVCSILRAMSKAELSRVANEVATLLAAASDEAAPPQDATVKAPRKRKAA